MINTNEIKQYRSVTRLTKNELKELSKTVQTTKVQTKQEEERIRQREEQIRQREERIRQREEQIRQKEHKQLKEELVRLEEERKRQEEERKRQKEQKRLEEEERKRLKKKEKRDDWFIISGLLIMIAAFIFIFILLDQKGIIGQMPFAQLKELMDLHLILNLLAGIVPALFIFVFAAFIIWVILMILIIDPVLDNPKTQKFSFLSRCSILALTFFSIVSIGCFFTLKWTFSEKEFISYAIGRGEHFYEKEDYKKSASWYEIAADYEAPSSYDWLGYYHYEGLIGGKDYKTAYDYFQKGAQAGDPQSHYWLGMMYFYGHHVEQDLKTAVSYFEHNIEIGGTSGYSWLGFCYFNGLGVTKNNGTGLNYYEMGVAKNNVPCIQDLASFYENGKYVEKDIAKAIELYTKAAELGDEESKERLEALKQDS